MVMQIQESKNLFNGFWVDMVKNEPSNLVHETLRSAE